YPVLAHGLGFPTLRKAQLRGTHLGEGRMRLSLLTVGVLLCAAAAGGADADAGGTAAGPRCLDASAVNSTSVIDDRTILFNMRNGTVWKNTLRQSCPNLQIRRGFSQVVRSGQICANKQIISVLGTGNTCQLGDFTPVSNPSPSAPSP